jgi:hypothetical protein
MLMLRCSVVAVLRGGVHMTGWVGYHGAADRLLSYSQVLAGSCWASQHLLKVQRCPSCVAQMEDGVAVRPQGSVVMDEHQ